MRLTYCLRRYVSKLELFKHIRNQGNDYGINDVALKKENSNKTVIVEYSSPNIAKPFHVGHLRSTILGNFVGNIYERYGWNVVRLNYLGDWGTQFGLLLIGFKKYGKESELEKNPLHHLLEVYVKVNSDVETEKKSGNSYTYNAGIETFNKLEKGDAELLALWQKFTDISLKEYTKLYKRLGVTFTEYHSESMYNEQVTEVTNKLKQLGLLCYDKEGKGYVKIRNKKGKEENVSVLKSNGSSLYITRDIAAILDRYERYKFDKIHYVVENAQHSHFCHLAGVIEQIPGWENRLNEDIHIKFGRISGISTRKGNVIFLKDFIEEAEDRVRASILAKQSTKVDNTDLDDTVRELGRSSILTQDLGQRRLKNYKFTWERIIYSTKLQYCHARLCSIERSSNLPLLDVFEEDHLTSNVKANELCEYLTKYESAMQESFDNLEPHIIVRYLDELCDLVNAAYKTCRVKDTEDDIAQAYLQMFNASKTVLANGMTLIGLSPLDKM
ncbi:Arginyl-tRNA synthetase [Mactra antiquata]